MSNKLNGKDDCESLLGNKVILGDNYIQQMKRNPHLSPLYFRIQFANTYIKKSNNET